MLAFLVGNLSLVSAQSQTMLQRHGSCHGAAVQLKSYRETAPSHYVALYAMHSCIAVLMPADQSLLPADMLCCAVSRRDACADTRKAIVIKIVGELPCYSTCHTIHALLPNALMPPGSTFLTVLK